MLKAVLFDFDGTLANDLSFFVKAYDYALTKYNIHLSAEEIAATCFNKPEEQITEQLGLPSAEEFRNYYFEGIKERFKNVPLFPGTTKLLDTLQKKQVKLGLISFAHRWYIDMMLEQTNIAHYFQSVVTFNDVSKPKPDPEAIVVSCKNLQVPINEMISVGDARNDVLMAKAAGCKTALFLPKDNEKFYNFDELRNLNPEFVASTYVELGKIII